MIVYRLQCADCGHDFDEWFANMRAYEEAQGTLECPSCGSPKVNKAIMAPRVASPAPPPPAPCGRPECPPGGCGARAVA